ncbi:MAG TPA: acyl-CoA thioesterase II [Mycobacteriales bacterium]|nr:acyl-CoA thioesterase II [Mycobacteriales bacterium]
MRAGLQQILDLEQIEDLVFRGRSREGVTETRVFGGEVAGQALVAAARTVDPGRTVHSLHAYFLRPGDPSRPILYQVDPIRDGRSFTTRRVLGIQRGEAIFTLSASFAVHEDGLHHQVPVLDAAAPEDLPPADTVPGREDWFARFPIELRFPDGPPGVVPGENVPPRQLTWMRSPERLPDDPALHACAATYFSDLLLLSTALRPHQRVLGDPRLQMASLDHAVWFHAPFRADDWLCYQQEGTWAGGARALCRGYLFDRHGTLVATVMQEGLIRLREAR